MNIYLNHSRPGARRRRRNRRHGALIIGALVLLALFAVIQIAGHLAVLAVIAAIAISAYYLGRHASRRARPGQAAPPRRQPEMPAAGPAAPMVTLPRTDPAHGQDEAPDGEQDQLGTRQPASVQAGSDRTRLLAAPMSGVRDLWGPS